MAQYTYNQIEAHVRKHCPLGWKIVGNNDLYKLSDEFVVEENGQRETLKILHIAYYHSSGGPNPDRVFAYLHQDGNKVSYGHAKQGHPLQSAGDVFPSDRKSNIVKFQEPYSLVIQHKDLKSKDEKIRQSANGLRQNQLELAIKLGYVVKGQVQTISHASPKGLDLLEQVVDLCAEVLRIKEHEEIISRVKAESSNSSNDENEQFQATMQELQSAQAAQNALSGPRKSSRVPKRRLTVPQNDEEDSDSDYQVLSESKRMRTPGKAQENILADIQQLSGLAYRPSPSPAQIPITSNVSTSNIKSGPSAGVHSAFEKLEAEIRSDVETEMEAHYNDKLEGKRQEILQLKNKLQVAEEQAANSNADAADFQKALEVLLGTEIKLKISDLTNSNNVQ